VKDWLTATGGKGTIKFLGTPAEEGGGGKVYMIRAGLFRDVDVAVTWHPGDVNQVSRSTSLANVSAKFRFRGLSAHAAAAPEQGRSALDGVEAMNAMVNLMREHIPAETRIHYVITAGGKAPNVVPDFAEVYYYARHSDMRILDGIWERIVNASKGAALGTGTQVEMEVVNAVYNILPNDALADVMQQALNRVGGFGYSPEESRFATEIRKTLTGTIPPMGTEEKVLPTVQMSAATWVPGTPAHSWQAVASGGTSIGAKGMMVAAKTMALTTMELFTKPTEIERAKAEFAKRVGDFRYTPKVGDRKPPLDYRK
jgi:aminobenzoyl-glutamate utilization protein B